jgi:Protein of unknown function (DUF3124)
VRPGHRTLAFVLAAGLALGGGLSCASKGPAGGGKSPSHARTGVTEVDPSALPEGVVRRTVYVPVYSHVYTSDAAHPFNLAVTLSVRNSDRAEPVYLTAVRYHDCDGRLVRDELRRPLRLAPLAAAEFFVKESDTTGGSSASYLVDWRSARPVSEPVVEAVMVGTAMNQGVSFTSPGRVVSGPGE